MVVTGFKLCSFHFVFSLPDMGKQANLGLGIFYKLCRMWSAYTYSSCTGWVRGRGRKGKEHDFITADLLLSCGSGATTWNPSGVTQHLRKIAITINSTLPPSTIILRKQGSVSVTTSHLSQWHLGPLCSLLHSSGHQQWRKGKEYTRPWSYPKKSVQVGITEQKEHAIYNEHILGGP